jgi:hypothetical protein
MQSMAETITEAASVGRPPKKPEDKFGNPKQVTLTPRQWDRVNEHLAAHDLQWMEFVRAAIKEKLARDGAAESDTGEPE